MQDNAKVELFLKVKRLSCIILAKLKNSFPRMTFFGGNKDTLTQKKRMG